MLDSRCHRCDRLLPDGNARYVVSIQVTADSDGLLPDADDPGAEIDRLLAAVEARSERSLAHEIHSEMSFLLCPHCRVRWLDNPLGVTLRRVTPSPAYLH